MNFLLAMHFTREMERTVSSKLFATDARGAGVDGGDAGEDRGVQGER